MADQKPKDDQGIDMSQWEATGLKPLASPPLKFSLPRNEASGCSSPYFITVPTPWEVK